MKKIIFLVAALCGFASCSDSFLDEKMVSKITQDYFDTEQGLEQLVVGTYNASRLNHGWSDGIYNFEMGSDMSEAQGNSNFSEYSSSEWSSTGTVSTASNSLMGQMSSTLLGAYPIINNCNRAIQTIESGSAPGKFSSDPSYAKKRVSEALFNRAICYYYLNTVFGDIYVTTTPTTSTPSNFNYPRTPSKDLYTMLISDMRYAYDNLPTTVASGDFGRATKYAAAHLLAKFYLQRAQAAQYGTTEYGRKSDGTIDNTNPKSYLGMLYKGSSSTDLDSCIYYSSAVINSGYYALESNYGDIFRHNLNDYTNEGSKENIFSAVYGSGTADNTRFGLRIGSYLVGNYVDSKYGIPTYCWEYGTAPQFGVFNNDFGYDNFTNKEADSRFQKSFRLEYKTALMGGGTSTPGANKDYYSYNDKNNTTYKWTQDQANYFNTNILPTYTRQSWGGRQAVSGDHKMGTGDLAFAYLENTKATAIDIKEAQSQPFVLYARWIKDGTKYYYRPQVAAGANTSVVYNYSTFNGFENGYRTGQPFTMKYDDPNRNSYNSYLSTRDIPIFRLSETYLIRAEAYGRKEGPTSQNAINDINKVRERAAFKAGETRNEVLARLYPGHENLAQSEQKYPYAVEKDETKSMDVDVSYWDGASDNSKAENYPPTANTSTLRFLNFIYNELGREMNQELIYYSSLHHSGLLVDRMIYHNQMASSLQGLWDTSDNVLNGQGQNGNGKGHFQNYYTLRPFPLTFLNQLTNASGKLLTDDEKTAYQNYGY